jgi:hypothetical protein
MNKIIKMARINLLKKGPLLKITDITMSKKAMIDKVSCTISLTLELYDGILNALLKNEKKSNTQSQTISMRPPAITGNLGSPEFGYWSESQ